MTAEIGQEILKLGKQRVLQSSSSGMAGLDRVGRAAPILSISYTLLRTVFMTQKFSI